MKAGAAVHTSMHEAVGHGEDLSACCWILCQCTHLVLLPLLGLHHPRHGVIVALHRQQLQRLFLKLQLRLVLSDRLARSHRGAECCKKNVGCAAVQKRRCCCRQSEGSKGNTPTDRGGYREPPELAEGGNKRSSGTGGNHRKTGREAERPPRSSSGGQPGPMASNQQPNHCSKAQY